MYYCYIVASRSHNFYVGMTSAIEKRIWQHKNGTFDGFSKHYNCNRLVWYERHPLVEHAIAREKQLKGWSRAKKIALIERENPAWVDLSAEWGKPIEMFDRERSLPTECDRRSFDSDAQKRASPLRMTLQNGVQQLESLEQSEDSEQKT